MKAFSLFTIASLAATAIAERALDRLQRVFEANSVAAYPYERLDKEKAVVVLVDVQVALLNLVRDFDSEAYRTRVLAHAGLAEAFDLPVVLTTSAQTGPNGPLLGEIREMHPGAPLIDRPGEFNAWDNPDFRVAIKATNRTQFILAGITTDVCTAFLAQSLRAEGYSVWANAEASGTTSLFTRDVTNNLMSQAGVRVMTFLGIAGELMRDWRGPNPSSEIMFPWYDRYFPLFGAMQRSHEAAVVNGTLFPGEEGLNGN